MSKNLRRASTLFFLIYGLTILLNNGFMGTDEYWTGITRFVPAQTQTPLTILKEDDVKAPSQILPLLVTSKLALFFGFKSSYSQYRFVHVFWALVCLFVIFLSLSKYLSEEERVWALLVFSLYCAAPFVFTRSMFESLSAPFVLLSALSLQRALENKSVKEALIATAAVSLAFAFRPQTGVAALALVFFLAKNGTKKKVLLSLSFGLALFVFCGLLDLWIRGDFHRSLKDILFYNVKFGATYSVQPWYFYLLFSIVLLMIPFLLSRTFIGLFKRQLSKQKIFWTYLVLILGLHSFFPQKWERFVIPVLPLLLLILSDWLRLLWQAGQRRRLYLILGFHCFLLLPVSFWPAQGNLIEMSLHLRDHKDIRNIYRYHRSPEWITEVFVDRQDWQWIEVDVAPQQLACHERLVMNQKDFEDTELSSYTVETIFQANPIEKLAFKLNPTKNVRRTSFYLLKSKKC